MISINWNLVTSILAALGIFKAVELVVVFSVENNLIKRNLEIRDTASRIIQWTSWLLARNFEIPLPEEAKNQLHLDSIKLLSVDGELSEDVMLLINVPVLIEFWGCNPGSDHEDLASMRKFHQMISSRSEIIIAKCNQLRYKPIVDHKKLIRQLKEFFLPPN